LAITSAVLLERDAVSRVLIVDLDVHQGDGTAAILAHEPRAFTMSVHAAANFPFNKQVGLRLISWEIGMRSYSLLYLVGTGNGLKVEHVEW
jgi:acetoin utilization deacetylase AcuC-like enzyme